MTVDTILLLIVLIAGFYMAWNIGANDVANAIGTSVGSGALSLRQAVIVAATLEFCGAYFFGSHVTDMVQQGIVNSDIFLQSPLYFVFGMLSALIAAGLWLQIASYFGLPVSTTHSIVGAIVGFGTAVGGIEAVYWNNVAYIASAWVLSPLIAAFLAYLIFNILRKQIFYAPCPVIAAKAFTPKIVFVFTSTLSIIMLFRGLHNIHLDFGWALVISLAIGFFCALISLMCVRRIISPSDELQKSPAFQPETLTALEKATKQLKEARKAMKGEMAYRATLAIEEVKQLTDSAQQRPASSSTDYQIVERIFGYLQMMSACLMAFAHGANDIANAIGPLSAALTTLTTGVVMVDTTPIASWTLAFGGIGIIIGLATWGWACDRDDRQEDHRTDPFTWLLR